MTVKNPQFKMIILMCPPVMKTTTSNNQLHIVSIARTSANRSHNSCMRCKHYKKSLVEGTQTSIQPRMNSSYLELRYSPWCKLWKTISIASARLHQHEAQSHHRGAEYLLKTLKGFQVLQTNWVLSLPTNHHLNNNTCKYQPKSQKYPHSFKLQINQKDRP